VPATSATKVGWLVPRRSGRGAAGRRLQRPGEGDRIASGSLLPRPSRVTVAPMVTALAVPATATGARFAPPEGGVTTGRRDGAILLVLDLGLVRQQRNAVPAALDVDDLAAGPGEEIGRGNVRFAVLELGRWRGLDADADDLERRGRELVCRTAQFDLALRVVTFQAGRNDRARTRGVRITAQFQPVTDANVGQIEELVVGLLVFRARIGIDDERHAEDP